MTSKEMAKRMVSVSKNYYESAVILNQFILSNNNHDIIYPVTYLLRHSLELILKSLILQTVPNQELNFKKRIPVRFSDNHAPFKIASTHSIGDMYDELIEIHRIRVENGDTLFGLCELEVREIKEKVKNINQVDFSGDTYKYPVDNKGNVNDMRFFEEAEEEGIANEIRPDGNEYVILGLNTKGEKVSANAISLFDENIINIKNDLANLIDTFLKHSDYKNLFNA